MSAPAEPPASVAARARAWFARQAPTVGFRLAVAVLCVAAHVLIASRSGARFGAPFNAAPGQPPAFRNPATERVPQRWDRLVVSRWDAGQYVELGLRGYRYCPPRGPEVPTGTATCNLAFYPAYGVLGGLVARATGLAIDYALWAIALVSSVVFLFLWTGPAIVSRLGLVETYLALLLFNTAPAGYTLATPQTEPITLALALGAFVALSRGRLLASALLAGAASGFRITGVSVTMAYAAALLVLAWRERPRSPAAWAKLGGLAVLAGWGELAFMAYQAVRFGSPFTYLHAHSSAFNHHITLTGTLFPDPALIVKSIEQPMHEGIWFAAALLWFLLGHRAALRAFPAHERAFWYVLFVASVGIASVGQLPIALAGLHRYLLLAVPLYFAMAAVMRAYKPVLAVWLLMTVWHHWNVSLCESTGGPGDRTLSVCHAGHWIKR